MIHGAVLVQWQLDLPDILVRCGTSGFALAMCCFPRAIVLDKDLVCASVELVRGGDDRERALKPLGGDPLRCDKLIGLVDRSWVSALALPVSISWTRIAH